MSRSPKGICLKLRPCSVLMMADSHTIPPVCLSQHERFSPSHFTIVGLFAPPAVDLFGLFFSRDIADQRPQGGTKDQHINHHTHRLQVLKTVKNDGELLLVDRHMPLARERRNCPNERDEQMDDPQGCEKRNREHMRQWYALEQSH